MHQLIRRIAGPVLFSVLVVLGAPGRASDEAKPAGEAGLSGTWALAAASDDDVVVKPKKEGWAGAAGEGGLLGRSVDTDGLKGFDLPLEVRTDARRLVVTDDGKTLRVTYPSGRKRAFSTDGGKRYLDDGDGPADVVAERKGTTVTVVSEWRRGYKLRETWELRESPRRLVVAGKVTGRESQKYLRTYEPAPPAPPPTPTPTASPLSTAGAGESPAPGSAGTAAGTPPPPVNRLGECSIHPPKNAEGEGLARLAKVSQQAAEKAAVASLAPLKASDVISSDPENYEGCLVWPFTLRLPGLGGVQEVFVDAGDGKVVASSFERTGPRPEPEP